MTRARFLREALRLVNTPYLWGGRGPYVDCWGLVVLAARRSGGQDYGMWWTQKAFEELPTISFAQNGSLSFYGPGNKIDHVAIHIGSGLVVVASGGNHTCTTIEISQAIGAKVTVYTVEEYAKIRTDLRGFRELPFEP